MDGWGDGTCRRNHGSYPKRLNALLNPGSFNFLSCSGADASHIIKAQVHSSHFGSPDLVTMTAGGDNDGVFVKILLGCLVNKKKSQCDKALALAETTAEKIPERLAPLYEDIKSTNVDPNKKRTIIHLSYVQMYNRDADKSECPQHGTDLSWPTTGEGGYRDKINKTILKMNAKIKEAAEKAGVIYVDVDPYYEGHRFCDGGEPWMQHHLNFKTGGVLCHPTMDGHGAYMNATLTALAQQV